MQYIEVLLATLLQRVAL